MDTGPSLHPEAACNDADKTTARLPQSPPPAEPPSVPRRKAPKKSIRNTKDSAEMARHKLQRQHQQPHHKAVDRHFSVANVGSNGTMYLRPVASPYPRAFRPPPTPPDTSDNPPLPDGLYWHDALHQSAAALVQSPRRRSSFDSGYSHRSRPDQDRAVRLRSPSLDLSPKQSNADTIPLLDLPIPNYRLGSPRFSDRGTAFLHNSFHTAFSSTTDLRHFSKALDQTDRLVPLPAQGHQNSIDLRRSPSVSWFSPSVTPAAETLRGRLRPSPLAAPPLELDQDEIPYTIYDKVAADPDNAAWVRYADGTNDIVAATPTRLVAEITSVKFLDYDLLSDFFLTYRAFLSPSDLARYLIARLRWAVSQTHESGRIVRVRTFVALRHWTLNYFTQDFEPDHGLRVLFCDLVNKLASDLARRPEGGGGDLQVLHELQKCWKRTCAMVWAAVNAPQVYMPIGPGSDDDQQWALTTRMRSLTGDSRMRNSSYIGADAPSLSLRKHGTASRLSEASVHATSCSFPRLKRSKPDLKAASGHRSPQKARGAFHRHKRSDSFSDALRDSRLDRPTVSNETAQVQVRPGRIIRGLVIHPSSANVIGPGPPSPPFLLKPEDTRPSMSETLLQPPDSQAHHSRLKIFGSMRRALSTRNPPKSSFSNRPKTANSGDLRKIRDAEPQPRDMIRQQLARKAQGVHTDALAAMVMRSWEQQGNDVPKQLPSDSLNISVTRNRSKTIHTDLPSRPIPSRLDSSVTTSSRSIVIVDDTGIDESERTPPLDRTISAIGGGLQRQTTRELNKAAFYDMAMNNTAFLLPDQSLSLETPSWSSPTKSATLSTAPTTLSIMSAPHSPPPAVPLPPLPGIDSPPGRVQFIGDIKPSPESEFAPSFGTVGLASPKSSIQDSPQHSFRKSSLVDPNDLSGPSRQLRRRPGGNLRAVDTVHDLGPTQRRQSTGSITSPISMYSSPTSTVTSPEMGDAQIASRMSRPQLRTQFTDGDLFEAARKSSLRLLSTHSSQRNLRPSMEVEVARFRAMSHDEDDGGVESTLLKLEGRFIPSRGSDKTAKSFDFGDSDDGFPTLTRQTDNRHPETRRIGLDNESLHSPKSSMFALAESPLIGSDVNRFAHRRHNAFDAAVLDEPAEYKSSGHQKDQPSIATRDFANSETHDGSERPATPEQTERPTSPDTPASTFLLDDGESLVDRNSMLARQPSPKPLTDVARSFFIDAEEEDAAAGAADHLRLPPGQHPLTPPTTADTLSDHGFDDFNVQLLLPGPPSAKPRKSFRLSELLLSDQFAKRAEHSALPRARNLPTHHTPFILAYSSEALALQFTLIEKDALDSVDWKDLINLNWSQKVPSVRDWAQYIHTFPANITDISSIDLIITRFNLVIKWCISSILLCSTSEERAQCITKFIHIATYSHRGLRNFATTAQITIALLSSDLARLTSTWAKVAQAEKDALKNLETLVSPMRNFAVLRAEMESAAAGLSDDDVSAGKGVIPFLGVYTRDLALNAQKAAFISPSTQPASGSQEKLVNFERHRTAASIVKGVLRLLDASSRYAIKPEAEVLAKCLWLAALADGEIAELSKGLER